MSRKKWLKFLMTFVLGLVALAWLRVDGSEPVSTPIEQQLPTSVEVATTSTNALAIRAVDGDTIEVLLDGSAVNVKVRLLGIDTPESVDPRKPVQCFGKEASKHTAELVEGKRVRLDADPKADEVDKYGRLLRNVILSDGIDLNAELVADGYAHAYLSYPLDARRKAELTRLQEEAKAAQRGLWNPETCAVSG
ncbi:thermonuclease family protein [Candidatus Uhrbacteria bacterium]|nr:thermonuclease family protein [Candidatus Uhrbacteria bacterium]